MTQPKKFSAFKSGTLLVASLAVAAAMMGNPATQFNDTAAKAQTVEQSAPRPVNPVLAQRAADNAAFLTANDGQSQTVEGLDEARRVHLSGDNSDIAIGGIKINYRVDADRLSQSKNADSALKVATFDKTEREIQRAVRMSLSRLLAAQDLSTVQNNPQAIGDALATRVQDYLDKDAYGASPLVIESVELSGVCQQVFDKKTGEINNVDCATIKSNPTALSDKFVDNVAARRASQEVLQKSQDLAKRNADMSAVCRVKTCG